MSYFKHFPSSLYEFANGEEAVIQNISLYVEVIDEVKTNGAFYQDYYIRNGDRSDNVSFNLYQNPRLHWTFYLMNDHLREQGWPLDHVEIVEKAKKDFPYITLTTEDSITGSFDVGVTVEATQSSDGSPSLATGVIRSVNLDLGQLVIETTSSENFKATDIVTAQQTMDQLQLVSVENQYLAAHHYVYGQEFYVARNEIQISGPFFTFDEAEEKRLTYPDYSSLRVIKTASDDIFTNVNDINRSIAVEVTNLDYYIQENDKLRNIIVLKPSGMNRIVSLFKEAIKAQ